MYDRATKEEIEKILTHRCKPEEEEQRKKILEKVMNTDVFFIPFDKVNHYTYKNQKTLILHYPIGKFLKTHIVEYILKRNLPFDGVIFINKSGNQKIIPYAECMISNIFLPNELEIYWNAMINKKNEYKNKTYYQIYKEYFKEDIINYNPEVDETFEVFFRQIGYNDSKIENKIIKLNNNGNVQTKNSSLLWIKCDVLENITSSYLNQNGKKISFYEYLKEFKMYKQSVAYGLSKSEYLNFRKYLKNSEDYAVGKDAIRKTFTYFDETEKLGSINYLTRYKIFSEEAWRDLICKPQFVYKDNNFREYIVLIHMIWEIKKNELYELVDIDTEVRCINISDDNKSYYLDAFIHLFNENRLKNIKLYIEFKNYEKTIYDDAKDFIHQPKSILSNRFYSDRYIHDQNDEWYYVAITKGSPYKIKNKSLKASGIKEENYIDLNWEELFDIISNNLYNSSYKSGDDSLINFLKFLERIY